jgi:hypothetical protein
MNRATFYRQIVKALTIAFYFACGLLVGRSEHRGLCIASVSTETVQRLVRAQEGQVNAMWKIAAYPEALGLVAPPRNPLVSPDQEADPIPGFEGIDPKTGVLVTP